MRYLNSHSLNSEDLTVRRALKFSIGGLINRSLPFPELYPNVRPPESRFPRTDPGLGIFACPLAFVAAAGDRYQV